MRDDTREDHQWHDATLRAVSIFWEIGRAVVALDTVIGPHEIIATGLRDLHLPRTQKWGPSVSVNFQRGPSLGADGSLDFAIHMQSGDVIVISADNFHGLTRTDLPKDVREIKTARDKIATIATSMLDGSHSFIAGARRIKDLWWLAQLPQGDPDKNCFVLINSETDTLPMGSARDLWNPQALAELQPKIDHAEQWAQETGRAVCTNLIRRLRCRIIT